MWVLQSCSGGLVRWPVCLFSLVLLGSALYATPIVIKLEGTVTKILEVTSILGGIVEVGDPVVAVYVYESTAPDTNPLPQEADYWHAEVPYGISAQAGDLQMATDPDNISNPAEGNFVMQIKDNVSAVPEDVYLIRSADNTHNIRSTPPVSFSRTGIQWKLVGRTTSALSGTALPVDAPSLTAFGQPEGFLMFGVITEQNYFVVTSMIASTERVTLVTSIADGDWVDNAIWDLGLHPVNGLDAIVDNHLIDIYDPAGATSLVVRGAEAELWTYDTLTITSDLNLEGGMLGLYAPLEVGGSISIAAGCSMVGGTTITTVGGISNRGEINLGSGRLLMVGGELRNHGLIRGYGRIEAPVKNETEGEIFGQSGQVTEFAASGISNAGAIYLRGGIFEFRRDLVNEPTGLIAGRGEVRVEERLTNRGSIAFSGGFSDVYGDVTNEGAASRIIVTGGSVTTFFDDVRNDGTMHIGTECGAVFLGSLSGAGGTSGPGAAYIEGDLRPGNSAAAVSFGGDVVLGPSAVLEIELGGTTPGATYDVLAVAGTAALDGTLRVKLIDGFAPRLGDTFSVVTFGSRTGDFRTCVGLRLGNGLALERDFDTPGSLTLTVIPSTEAEFKRGYVNADDRLNVADPVFILAYLFSKGTAPECMDAADVNDDGKVNVADPVFILMYLFSKGPPLPEPFLECGPDPTTENDRLDCAAFRLCGP